MQHRPTRQPDPAISLFRSAIALLVELFKACMKSLLLNQSSALAHKSLAKLAARVRNQRKTTHVPTLKLSTNHANTPSEAAFDETHGSAGVGVSVDSS
jgi:hypothetical protein